MHLVVGGCSERPIKCGLSVGEDEVTQATLMVGTRSISTFYEVPRARSAVTMTHAQGVISCKAGQAVENSLSVAQTIQQIAHTKSRG